MISLIVIFSILFAFTMFLRYVQHALTLPYAETTFDLIIQGFSEEQISDIRKLPFVDEVFPARILSGEIKKDNKKEPIRIYAADSFENRNVSFFLDRLLIKRNKEILMNAEMNPIIIDLQIARMLKVGIGDTVSLPFGKNRSDVSFTVAAISEPMESALGLAPVMILWRGEQRSVFVNSFGKDPTYSYMFIKTNDKKRAKEYFLNEYIPMELVADGYFSPEDKDEILRHNSSLTIDREKHLDELYYELRYTPPIVILASVLGFITYLLVLYREANKKLLMREKEFSILHALGMPKIYFMLYSIIETAVFQIPVIAASALIVKYFFYDFLAKAYLPWYLFIWYCLGAFALQMAAVLINGFLLYIKMMKINIATQLAKE